MQPPLERSTGELYEQLLRFSKNISGSRNSQEVMQAVASELPFVLTDDNVGLFLNDERGCGTSWDQLTQDGEIHNRHAAEFLSQRGMQPVCVIPVTANQLRLGTTVVARKSIGCHPDVAIALATLQLPR